MKVAVIVSDLILIDARLTRLDTPKELPPAIDGDLLLVDWSSRAPEWADAIATWTRMRRCCWRTPM